jgi:hypothetical protein
MAAAVLSTSHPGDPYRALALFSAEMHLEAAAVAGAIGANPDLVVPP